MIIHVFGWRLGMRRSVDTTQVIRFVILGKYLRDSSDIVPVTLKACKALVAPSLYDHVLRVIESTRGKDGSELGLLGLFILVSSPTILVTRIVIPHLTLGLVCSEI